MSNPRTNSLRLSWDIFLQRLFSTFPNSWPGVGLLLLRLGIGIPLLYFASAGLTNSSEAIVFVPDLIAAAGGIFLLAGLWTPLIGTFVCLDEVWIVLLHYSPQNEHAWIRVLLAIMAASVAMLGPGASSMDARLFGRKRFGINPSRRPSL